MGDSKFLALTNLCVWYTPEKPVLYDFSIDIRENEVIGLIGLNGAGKTTFIKTMSGLHNNFSVEKAVFLEKTFQGKAFQGKNFSFRDNAFKQNRYTVFAEDHSFRYFTFYEYLSYAAASYGKDLPDVTELVCGFRFEEYTNVLLKELSTGNLKKAYLITAFALRPKLLLLDEPVNGLDYQSTEFLYRQINDYRRYGTVLFASHILESICLTSDRVLVLEHGKVKRSFAGEEVDADRIREVLAQNDGEDENIS